AGTNTIDAFNQNGKLLLADFDSGSASSTGTAIPTVMEAMIAPGDSGGGLFVTNGLGQMVLAGITSFGSSSTDRYGGVGFWDSVYAYAPWIDCVIDDPDPSKAGTDCGSSYTYIAAPPRTDVPEPSGLAVFCLGLIWLAVRGAVHGPARRAKSATW